MVKQNATSPLRTRHISCFYCIALSLFILSVVLFALSSEQSQALGNDRSRTPVIISASIILVLSVLISIWITYYAVGYFRLKKHQQIYRASSAKSNVKTPSIVFANAAFTHDDSQVNKNKSISSIR